MEEQKRERLEVEVPSGKVVISMATCPNGCDLMDHSVQIKGHASIRLEFEYEGKRGPIYLDPVYGGHENVCEEEIPVGAVVEFYCPHCGVSLKDPGATCQDCGAPMFALSLPRGGFVEACQRNGCFFHKLRIVTGEDMMQRLFDDIGMDSFL